MRLFPDFSPSAARHKNLRTSSNKFSGTGIRGAERHLAGGGRPGGGNPRGGAAPCRKRQRTTLSFDHQRGGLLQKALRRGQTSSICEKFLMADFTLEILTWANIEQSKGKPTHRLFPAHISAIFVRTPTPHGKNDSPRPLMSSGQPAGVPKRALDLPPQSPSTRSSGASSKGRAP